MKKMYLLVSLVLLTCVVSQAQHSSVTQPKKPSYFLIISKFKGEKLKPFSYHHNVYLRRRGQYIFPSDSLGLLTFDGLAATDTIDLIIKSGRRIFSLTKIAGWSLRDGARVAVGTIPKLWKLKSIAEQDDYSPTDTDYAMWRTRYRIAPAGTTVDLTEISHLKKLVYINCCTYNGQCIMSYRATNR